MVLSPKGVSFCRDKQRLRVLATNVTGDTNQAFSEVRTESVVKIQFVVKIVLFFQKILIIVYIWNT